MQIQDAETVYTVRVRSHMKFNQNAEWPHITSQSQGVGRPDPWTGVDLPNIPTWVCVIISRGS